MGRSSGLLRRGVSDCRPEHRCRVELDGGASRRDRSSTDCLPGEKNNQISNKYQGLKIFTLVTLREIVLLLEQILG